MLRQGGPSAGSRLADQQDRLNFLWLVASCLFVNFDMMDRPELESKYRIQGIDILTRPHLATGTRSMQAAKP